MVSPKIWDLMLEIQGLSDDGFSDSPGLCVTMDFGLETDVLWFCYMLLL